LTWSGQRTRSEVAKLLMADIRPAVASMMSAAIQSDVQTFREGHRRQHGTDKTAPPESETALTNRANFNLAGDLQAGLNVVA
jgi:hypothetical protein